MDYEKNYLLVYFHKECLHFKMKRNINHSKFEKYYVSLVNAAKYQSRITINVKLKIYFTKIFYTPNQ